tara:strand:- start:1498 stop:1815 length:318 start_codon:yes stop_codon:yes gene_type:complete
VAKGDWCAAHGLVQSQDDADGAWMHSYLHRVDGNADYLYHRARRPHCTAPSPEERRDLADKIVLIALVAVVAEQYNAEYGSTAFAGNTAWRCAAARRWSIMPFMG